MGNMTAVGEVTKSLILKGIQAHVLHQEFQVTAAGDAVVTVGQPVVLNADGTVSAAASGALAHTILGTSIHIGANDEYITVATKAKAIIWAKTNAACAVGPVKYAGQNTAEPVYMACLAATDGTDTMGWALDAADGANDLVRVAII